MKTTKTLYIQPKAKTNFSPKIMATKKSVKKVEITDEGVLDLKSREKPSSGFTVHKIHEKSEPVEIPIDRYNRPQLAQAPQAPQASQASQASQAAEQPLERHVSTTEAIMERPARSVKYDTDALQQRMETFAEKLEQAVIKVSPGDHPHQINNLAEGAKELIKVKFDKFVMLVASRDFLSVLEKNKNEDIILSSNLLTDLAGAVEEKSEKKTPVIFLVGLAIGVIVTYLLINR